MIRHWNRWINSRNLGEGWYYSQVNETSYGWLKQIIISTLLFTIVYGIHCSETFIGEKIDNEITYLLTTETDFNYIVDEIVRKFPRDMDVAVFKKITSPGVSSAEQPLPMIQPVEGKILIPFGWKNDKGNQASIHQGIDIETLAGTTVKAAANGTIKLITDSKVYGKVIIIEHNQDTDSLYGYVDDVLVAQGEQVSQGQVIARTSGPRMYFEIREQGKAVDPLTKVKGSSAPVERK
ncbi:hypothetical protein P22_3582 [Propionispora sp. 2/2-37]|uniref:murein hydrolase activator EnvC family protein n=1 Tax=Propionispora sp. 2/2-37 TaxID=1677858 RepID=UPI0006BB8EFC|nr:M23 family metallopeptidase [Propionispora sp. 2/2-37]CUH97452.1 hypothetical protein P22_3582 [Propionispora sp. 2/2-37]